MKNVTLADVVRRAGARIVGIAGAPGSGKSTLARATASSLGGALVVSTDDYYLSKSSRERLGMRFRGPPGSHDVKALVAMLEAVRSGRGPITVQRFSSEQDDQLPPDVLDEVPSYLLLEGLILGYRGGDYGRILELLDLFVFLDVDEDVAKSRRFAREDELRKHGGGFTEQEMQDFWDEVLQPAVDTWVADARRLADLVIRVDSGDEILGAEARNEAVMAALGGR